MKKILFSLILVFSFVLIDFQKVFAVCDFCADHGMSSPCCVKYSYVGNGCFPQGYPNNKEELKQTSSCDWCDAVWNDGRCRVSVAPISINQNDGTVVCGCQLYNGGGGGGEDASCGQNEGDYAWDADWWRGSGSSSFCSKGDLDGSRPDFPGEGGTVSWTCKGENGGANQTCTATRGVSPVVDAECGSNQGNYDHDDYNWPHHAYSYFCSKGNLVGGQPVFPNQDDSVEWECEGENGGTNKSCSAFRAAPPEPENGLCGSAAKQYSYEETNFTGSLCSSGSCRVQWMDYPIPCALDPFIGPPRPSFPEPGGSTSWMCKGINDGVDDNCSASRLNQEPDPINAVCGPAATNSPYAADDNSFEGAFCEVGSLVGITPDFPDQNSTVTWECGGIDGGENVECSASRLNQEADPIDAVCGPAATNSPYAAEDNGFIGDFCEIGSLLGETPNFPERGEYVLWTCEGIEGGSDVECSASRLDIAPITPDPPTPTPVPPSCSVSNATSDPVSITSDVEGLVINTPKNVYLSNRKCRPLSNVQWNNIINSDETTKLNSADVDLTTSLASVYGSENYLNNQNAWSYFPWSGSGRILVYNHLLNGFSHINPYQLHLVPWHKGGYNLTLNIENKNPEVVYTCNCPPSVEGYSNTCLYGNVNPPIRTLNEEGVLQEDIENYNFFVTAWDNSNGDWWQAINGNVYSGEGITSLIPQYTDLEYLADGNYTSCTDDTGCIPRIIKSTAKDSFLELSNASEKSGIPLTKEGGEISYGENPNADYTHRPISNESYQGVKERAAKKENYDYFERLYEERSGSELSFSQDCPNEDDCQIYYQNGNETIDLANIDDKYTTSSLNKKVFFIDGDLTIEDNSDEKGNKLEVGEDKFLAFIISGDLIIEGSVGYNNKQQNPGQPAYFNPNYSCAGDVCNPFEDEGSKRNEVNLAGNVQGMFIVDGNIEVQDNDELNAWQPRKFIGEGSFISFSQAELNRKFSDKKLKENDDLETGKTINSYHSAINFRYRPDLVLNTPEWMKHTKKLYQEFN